MKDKNATEVQKKKRFLKCMEKVPWLINQMSQKGFAKFLATIYILAK